MNMIDKFLKLVSLAQMYEKNNFFITSWKMYFAKKEITKEIKNKEYYGAEDLCNYGWIINWALEKWKDDKFMFPDFFSMHGVDGCYTFEFNDKEYMNHFSITAKNIKSSNEIIINSFQKNRREFIITTDSIVCTDRIEFMIFYKCIFYTINHILTKLIRGDKS